MKYSWIIMAFLFITYTSWAGECDFLKYGKCGSCDDPLSFMIGSEEACVYLCPNRETNDEGSGISVYRTNCALKECPPSLPFRTKFGDCFATEEEADHYLNTFETIHFKSTPTISAVDGKCPDDKPLLEHGMCYPCDEVDDLSISKEACDKCPNRVYKVYPVWQVEHCELPCPPDKPLQRWDGTCFSCDEPDVILIKTNCNLERDCEDVCPNRTIIYGYGGNVPSVLNCPPDKPLMDSDGICFACDEPVDIGMQFNEERCSKICPQREAIGMICVLKKKN